MRREDEELMHADRELMDFPYYCQRLVRIYDDLIDINARINNFGVSSPKLMSIEEAKYQKGTKIYSDVPMLELFAEEDKLKAEFEWLRETCSRTRRKLISMYLDDEELSILYYRYERRMTFEQIAFRLNYSDHGIRWKLDKILMGIAVR